MKSLFNKQARKRLVQAFVRHAGFIQGLFWSAGNAGLVIKNLIPGRPTNKMELFAGVGYLAMSTLVILSDRFPVLKRPGGAFGVPASVAFAKAAAGLTGKNFQRFGCVVWGVQSLAMMFEKDRRDPAEMQQVRPSRHPRFSKLLTLIREYPLACTVAFEIATASLPLTIAAIARKDWAMLPSCATWIVGNLAAFSNDNGVKSRVLPQPKAPHIS